MLLIIVIIVIYDLHGGIFHHAVTVNNHPLKLFTWGPYAWKEEYIVFIHERRNHVKSSDIIDKLMSECANLL